jgi:hypothetical protein
VSRIKRAFVGGSGLAAMAAMFGAFLPPPARREAAAQRDLQRQRRSWKRHRAGYLVRTINEAMKRGGTPVRVRNPSRFLHSSRSTR